MKFTRLATVAAIAFSAAAAHAGPTEIGTGLGTFDFTGNKTHSFYIDVDPGTYSFESMVSSNGTTSLDDVWFSPSKDKKDVSANDIDFTRVSSTEFDGNVSSYTFTAPTRVYIDVKAMQGNGAPGYNGSLTISAVPEPTTTALLLAGLGMMGFVGRRRRG